MSLKKEAHVPHKSTKQPSIAASGLPHISDESMKMLQAMDAWYTGPLSEPNISEEFKKWV